MKVLRWIIGICGLMIGAHGVDAQSLPLSSTHTESQKANQNHIYLEQLLHLPLYDVNSSQESQLLQYQGKPLLINFWATWCAPCVREMPLLDQFAKRHPMIQVVGLGLDSQKNIQQFQQKIHVDYDVYRLDIKHFRLLKKLGDDKSGLPFSLLVSSQGEILWSHAGELHEENLKKIIKSLNSL